MHILFIVALFSPIPNSVSIKMFSCPLCAYKKNKIYYQTKTLREIQNHATTKLCPPELSDICVNTMNTKRSCKDMPKAILQLIFLLVDGYW